MRRSSPPSPTPPRPGRAARPAPGPARTASKRPPIEDEGPIAESGPVELRWEGDNGFAQTEARDLTVT